MLALLRVCGVAGRPDEALRVVYAMRKDGCRIDASCYTAYERGVEEADATVVRGPGALLQGGYERLLMMETCPERVQGPRLGGRIERIRIKF